MPACGRWSRRRSPAAAGLLETLTCLLLPHLDQEVAEAMPVVAQTLTAGTLDAISPRFRRRSSDGRA